MGKFKEIHLEYKDRNSEWIVFYTLPYTLRNHELAKSAKRWNIENSRINETKKSFRLKIIKSESN